MNVLEHSLKLGQLLRKTEEGTRLLKLKTSIVEKYKGNDDFSEYMRFAEQKSSSLYYFAWDAAYNAFLNVLKDETLEHRAIFVPTAELVASDEAIKHLAKEAVDFGKVFEKLTAVIISGGKYENEIPATWKYKIRTAISDVQIAVERTLLHRTIALFYQKNNALLNNAATKKYLEKREEKKLLPFSEEARQEMANATDITEEEKLLYEKMYLITEAVKKGVFYGFWGMVNEIASDELIEYESLQGSPLKEVSFVYSNNYSSFWGRGWLYKIQLDAHPIFFMAHKKSVQLEPGPGKSTVDGIVYPANDIRLFEE